jgi:beta-galactosidase
MFLTTKWILACRNKCLLSIALSLTIAANTFSQIPVYHFSASGRSEFLLNDNWKYFPDGLSYANNLRVNDSDWASVSIPHTWNAQDPFDDVQSYRRGISWYRKHFRLSDEFTGKRFFLRFEGVNQTADVYVNGGFAGSHKGGYTSFTIDITEFLQFGEKENLIAVMVSNAQDHTIPPLSVGYALYGGIYRDVRLICTESAHFDLQDYGSDGIYIYPAEVSESKAKLSFKARLVNSNQNEGKYSIEASLIDKEGVVKKTISSGVSLAGNGKTTEFTAEMGEILRPELWSPDSPYLYTLEVLLKSNGVIIDRQSIKTGFRWFSFDPQSGFSLNGKKLFLQGTNRHQDMQYKGSALSNEEHVRDLEIIKNMGCNFLRLAHYPQDPAVLEAADRLGLLIWEEIPVVNYIDTGKEFALNCQNAAREMIRQHFNHPSVILWGSMNEVFLHDAEDNRVKTQKDSIYLLKVKSFADTMDSLLRREDPSRYTTIAIHGSGDYKKYGISTIPMVLGLNNYDGWYSGTFSGFSESIAKRHLENPNQTLMISEYGAENDYRINSTNPERFDFSDQWCLLFHESYLRQARQFPYLAGVAIWNQFDFANPWDGGVVTSLNQKGMYTWDRKPKNVFYLYKANWNPEPMVYIASRDWPVRVGFPSDKNNGMKQSVTVYANTPEVELFLNGKSLGIKKPDDIKKTVWDVNFINGKNILSAKAKTKERLLEDKLEMECVVLPEDFRTAGNSFKSLAINIGGNVQYDGVGNVHWLPDQPYREGRYGYLSGERMMLDKKLQITHTTDVPLYFTCLKDVAAYRIDVPDGEYMIEVHFIEDVVEQSGESVFSVSCNGIQKLSGLTSGLSGETSPACFSSFDVEVKDGKGILLNFEAQKGHVKICGIKVNRK